MPSNRVFVGNLSPSTTSQGLKEHMIRIFISDMGDVKYAKVYQNRHGNSGSGIVEFSIVEGAKAAIQILNDSVLDGRNILVREDRGDGTGGGGVAGRGEPCPRVDEALVATREIKHHTNTPMGSGRDDGGATASRGYYCNICDIWLSNDTEFTRLQHVNGKKHRKHLLASPYVRSTEGNNVGEAKVLTHHLLPTAADLLYQTPILAHLAYLCESDDEEIGPGEENEEENVRSLCDAFGAVNISNTNAKALDDTKVVNVNGGALKEIKHSSNTPMSQMTPSNHPHSNHKPIVSNIVLKDGLETLADAVVLQGACQKGGSMLRKVLKKVAGLELLVLDENSTPSVCQVKRSCTVTINTTHFDNKTQYLIVLDYRAGRLVTTDQREKIVSIFDSYTSAGFLDWLSGERGWKFHNPPSDAVGSTVWKKRIVTKLNILQGVHSLFAPATQKYFFGSSGRMMWRKQNELTDVVNDIRVWVETITPKTELTRWLLRNSAHGPNSLVHWAHHSPVSFCVWL